MKFKTLIESMRTVRDFKEDSVDPNLIEKVIEAGSQIRPIVEGIDLSIHFIEDGPSLYEKLSGKTGYYGNMIEAPHYLAVLSKEHPNYIENSGYVTEWIRLKAWELGLGTCWLSFDSPEIIKPSLEINDDKIVTALIAIGYPYTGVFKSDVSPTTSRIGITDFVYVDSWGNTADMEDLNARGMTNTFYFSKLAPSWGNKQPWRFIIDKEKVLLLISKEQPQSMLLDAGIMMLYLEKAAQSEGLLGKWQFKLEHGVEIKYNIPPEYLPVAYYTL